MLLKKLDFLNFRNLENHSLEFHPNKNYFLGPNGQGKTNLLEAIYFLVRARSFRPAEANSLISFGRQQSAVFGDFQHRDMKYKIKAQILEKKKNFFVNDKAASGAKLQAIFPVVLFSPESLSIIKDSAEQRRAIVDEIVCSVDPTQTKIQAEFAKTLRTRNQVLKEILKSGPSEDRQLVLESISTIFLVLATHVCHQRILALQAIWRDFEKAIEFIFSGHIPKVSAEYLISGQSAMHWNEQKIYQALHTRQLELSNSEHNAGHSLVGPHKHDIKILFDEKDSRFYCSQGQQRALILALKIAQIVYHHRVHQKYPILLLDDVLSELDEYKRSNLMKFLGEISAQVFITSTEHNWSESGNSGSLFFVKTGRIEKSSEGERRSSSIREREF